MTSKLRLTPSVVAFFLASIGVPLLFLSLVTAWDVKAIAAQDAAVGEVPTETWYGELDAGPRLFRFTIELQEADGNWTGTLTSHDEGQRRFPLANVKRTEGEFEFEISVSAAKYVGQLDAATGEVAGKWKQGKADLPLDFKKVPETPTEELAVVWSGTLKVLFQKLEIQFRELKTGKVYMDSLSQKVGGFVTNKSIEGNKVTLDVPAIQAKFEGELSEGGKTLTGRWKQNIVSVELVLTRSDDGSVLPQPPPPSRPQTPQAPFPYDIQEVQFANENADIRLSGTLTVPTTLPGPFPAVILISGSGPQDRDETLMEHKPFWVIADHFSRNGIATLRYDDRGVGKSTGNFSTANSKDFADDAEAALRFLQKQSKIDSEKIGFCGHSEGGLIAPMIAARNSEVGFIILLAGPGVNGERIGRSQSELILKATGASEDEIARQVELQRIFVDLSKTRPKLSSDDFKSQAKVAVEEHLTESEKARGAGEQMIELAIAQLQNPWFEYFMVHDPAKELEQVSCPVLALNGEKDLQVDPKLNLPIIEAALKKSACKDFQVVELPGLNHLFQNCTTGMMDEYAEIEETFDPATLTRMSDWINARQK